MLKDFVWDLRLALRSLAKRPLLVFVVTVSLALGIGVNSAVFTIAKAFFLQPLPVREPSRLVALYTADDKNPGFFEISYPNLIDLRAGTRSFSGLLAHHLVGLVLGGREPAVTFGEVVSGNYFDVLGIRPALGRFFTPAEDSTNAPATVVLSHSLWQHRFGADPQAIGTTILLNRRPFTIVGVAPAAFTGTDTGFVPTLWVPLGTYRTTLPEPQLMDNRRGLSLWVIGRLQPGANLATAGAEMRTLASGLAKAYPDSNKGRSLTLLPLAQAAIHPNVRQSAALATELLLVVTCIVLLVVCANVASLLLARAAERRREIAVQLCLGAPRGRLIRQLLAESAVLGLLGAAFSLLLAAWLPRAVWSLLPPLPLPVTVDLGLDLRVLGFTLLLALLSVVLFGLAPALAATRLDQTAALKEKIGATRGKRLALRRVLVAAQVSLCLVSLLTSGLFLRSLSNTQHVDPGFAADQLGIISFSLGAQGYSKDQAVQFYDRTLASVRALPGVRAASLAAAQPLGGGAYRSVLLDSDSSRTGVMVALNVVASDYLTTMGIPIVRGRDLNPFDRLGTAAVAVVNQTMARRFWPGQDPVGQHFRLVGSSAPTTVVGVARDSKYASLGESPTAYAYLPLSQNFTDAVVLHVRAQAAPAPVLLEASRAVRALDPGLPLIEVATVPSLLARSLWAARMAASAIGFFGVLTLVLTTVGLYGLIAYSVKQRTTELGLRMALGARPLDVQRMMVRQGMTLVAIGLGIGLIAGLALSQLLAGLLYGIRGTDLLAATGSVLVLAAVALLATYLPSRRATEIEPMDALRIG